MPRRLHRIGGRPLLGEVDDAVGFPVADQGDQAIELLAHRHVDEVDGAAADFAPCGDALAHGADGGQGLNLQLVVDVAAAEVVDDQNLPAPRRQVQGRGPAAEAVAAENDHPHWSNPVSSITSSCLADGGG
ncbi:hypothetical protein D3C72_1337720 [compost metagenome]